MISFRSLAFALPIFLSWAPLNQGDFRSSVLTNDDYSYEWEDSQKEYGAILVPLPDGSYENYYSQWQCFHSSQIGMRKIEAIFGYDESKWLPQVDAETTDEHFELSGSADDDYDLDIAWSDWQFLIDDADEVCIYSTFLQTMPSKFGKPNSLRIVSRIKTKNGEWSHDLGLNIP